MKAAAAYFFLCYFQFILGAQTVTFEKNIDFSLNIEQATSVLAEQDGYVICGFGSEQDFGGFYAVRLVKTDLLGNIIWSKNAGKDSSNFYSGIQGSLIKMSDGGYVLGGSIEKIPSLERDAMLIRFDSSGDTVFTKFFGGANDDEAYSCITTSDSGYAVLGYTKSRGDADGDYYLVKTDSAGIFQWDKTYGGNRRDGGLYILPTNEGGFLLGGGGTIVNNRFQTYLIKTDENGNATWDTTYGGGYPSCGAYITPASDGYVFSSCTDSIKNSQGESAYLITRIDTAGNVIWQKFFPHTKYSDILMVREIPSGGFIFCGRIEDDLLGDVAGLIVKLDSSGNTAWERRYAHKSDFFFFGELWDIQPTSDGGFVATGMTADATADFWILKLDSLGCINGYCGLTDTNCYYQPWPCEDTVGIKSVFVSSSLADIYPNPSSETIFIDAKQNGCTIRLFNLLNQEVFMTKLLQGKHPVSIAPLAPGLYLYVMRNSKNEIQTGKLIVE